MWMQCICMPPNQFLLCLILFLWPRKHPALVDVASLLVLQQTIVTVPERLHPAPKLHALLAQPPLLSSFINLVKNLHPESDKKQIQVLYHLSKSRIEGPSTRPAQVSMMYLQWLTQCLTWKPWIHLNPPYHQFIPKRSTLSQLLILVQRHGQILLTIEPQLKTLHCPGARPGWVKAIFAGP